MNGLVSIVVPIYNAEKFLKKCLDSIASQTYKNWEAFLVIDGATDNSLEICNSFAEEDSRFCVLSKENAGPSAARNYAFPYIAGEYVTFVDSDDYLEPDYLYNLVTNMIKNNSDLSMCGYVYEDEEGNPLYTIDKKSRSYSREDIIKEMYLPVNRSWGSFLWNKLYSVKIIKDHNITFKEECRIFEDSLFNYQYLKWIKTGYFTTEPYYHYIKRGTSAMHSKANLKDKYLYYTLALDEILKDSKENDKLYYEQIRLIKCIHTATALRVLAHLKLKRHPRYIIERRFLRKNIFLFLFCTDIPFSKRTGALLTLIFPKLAYKMWSK